MKAASPALIKFLNEVIGFYDGQLVMADAFLFALKSGANLGYTNSEITFTFGGQQYLGNDVLIDGLKYKCSIGLDVDKQQINVAARADQTIPGGAQFLQALRSGAPSMVARSRGRRSEVDYWLGALAFSIRWCGQMRSCVT
jgi:hypothetical protein